MNLYFTFFCVYLSTKIDRTGKWIGDQFVSPHSGFALFFVCFPKSVGDLLHCESTVQRSNGEDLVGVSFALYTLVPFVRNERIGPLCCLLCVLRVDNTACVCVCVWSLLRRRETHITRRGRRFFFRSVLLTVTVCYQHRDSTTPKTGFFFFVVGFVFLFFDGYLGSFSLLVREI